MSVNPCAPGNEMATGALVATTAASSVLVPGFWPLVAEVFLLQGDPGAMFEAAVSWSAAADELGGAIEELDSIRSELAATGWSGDDHDEFERAVADLRVQLLADQLLATTTSVVLVASAAMIMLAIGVVTLLAAYLTVCAGFYLSMLAGIVTGPGAEVFKANVLLLVNGSFTPQLKMLTGAIETATTSFAWVLGGMLGADALAQLFSGNVEVLEDLGEATVDSLTTITAGAMAYLLNKGLGQGIETGNMTAVHVAAGGAQVAGVDPDNDVLQLLNLVNLPGLLVTPEHTDGLPDD